MVKNKKSKKWKCFAEKVIFTLFFVAILFLIKWCDLPNWSGIEFFNKPVVIPNVIFNLTIGYVVTVFFYILIEFIPEKKREEEIEEQKIFYRSISYRAIQLLTSNCVAMYKEIGKYEKGDSLNANNLFSVKRNKQICKELMFKGDSYIRKPTMEYMNWYEAMYYNLNKVHSYADASLNQSPFILETIPNEVYQAILFIKDSSYLFGGMFKVLPVIYMSNKGEGALEYVIAENEDDTQKNMDILIKWVNEEYEFLKEKGYEKIYPIKL